LPVIFLSSKNYSEGRGDCSGVSLRAKKGAQAVIELTGKSGLLGLFNRPRAWRKGEKSLTRLKRDGSSWAVKWGRNTDLLGGDVEGPGDRMLSSIGEDVAVDQQQDKECGFW